MKKFISLSTILFQLFITFLCQTMLLAFLLRTFVCALSFSHFKMLTNYFYLYIGSKNFMARGYRFGDIGYPHFITFAVVNLRLCWFLQCTLLTPKVPSLLTNGRQRLRQPTMACQVHRFLNDYQKESDGRRYDSEFLF